MKNLKTMFLLLAGVLVYVSCHKEDTPTIVDFNLNENFNLKYEQQGQLTSGDLEFRVTAVLNDSRCPIDVFCISPGLIHLELEIHHSRSNTTRELKLGIDGESHDGKLEIYDYEIQLLSVAPGRLIDEDLQLEDYIFTFKVEKI